MTLAVANAAFVGLNYSLPQGAELFLTDEKARVKFKAAAIKGSQ